MADRVNVDPAVLQQAADGINAIIGELADIGTTEAATTGRGFALLRLSGMQAGEQSVHQEFSTFTSRWSWGIRTLVQAGNTIAEILGLAAGRFHDTEQANSTALKESVTDLMGNPYLSKDQIDARTWSGTVADNGVDDILHPDYRAQSFDNAAARIGRDGQAIAAVAPDAAENVGLPSHWHSGDAARAAQIVAGPGGHQ
ncbi:type VII secretion target [Nocardia sp. alder85J]|uniref:type VII secretion target n=1 Tax=Nocardia sp. alder85J TaxID=2862949 RepID=UPI001CD23397|nr:type VII secretion target [Nocardia sp. alder85J]MCX4092711.1 hypothetical protein [Nocardia sp. alder85J]